MTETRLGALDRQPENTNLLTQLGFRFQVQKLPHVDYFSQRASIPGLDMSPIIQPTAFIDYPQPSKKITYSPLTISFAVDEDLKNYLEIYNWIMGLGSPNNFIEYKNLLDSGPNISYNKFLNTISDCTLTILSNKNNPRFIITFQDAFPISLSQIDFDSTMETVEPPVVDATFAFRTFKIERV